MPIRIRRSFDQPGSALVNPRLLLSNPYMGQTSLLLSQGLGINTSFRLLPQVFSKMIDIVANRGKFNPVEHVIITHNMSNFAPWQQRTVDGGPTINFNFSGIAFPVTTTEDMMNWPWLPNISAANLSDWSLEALNKFQEQVPTTVSLANFMYELREMKGMIPSINRSSISKTASNNFLAYKFGVEPFIKDIKAILDMSDSVSKRIKHLLEMQGKASSLSFNRTTSYDDPFSFNKSYCDPSNVYRGQDIVFKRLGAKTELHIGAKLFQDLQGLEDSLATLKALAASGGFNHPARIIWNAIPYSFVVDWFFHVGKLLDSLMVQPFGGTYNVSDVGYSLTSAASYYVTQVIASSVTSGQYPTQVFPLGTVSFRGYVRRVGYPVSSLLLTNGTLTPTQQVLSLAMLNQRRR